MPDLRLALHQPSPIAVTFDLLQSKDGNIDETKALATAVVVALGTDRRANDDDILPADGDTNQRGWWADQDAERIWDGWPIGSKLWLLERHKITGVPARQGSTLARAESYVRDALQPFIDKRIASRIDVDVQRTEVDRIVVNLVIYRGPLPAIQLQYQSLWTE